MRIRFTAAALVLVSLWSVGAPLTLSASTQIARQASALKKHSCCPHGQSAFALPLFVSPTPATMPCGGQSPCCAKQAPAKPALLALNQNERPASEIAPLWMNGGPSSGRASTGRLPPALRPPSFCIVQFCESEFFSPRRAFFLSGKSELIRELALAQRNSFI